MNRPGLCFVFLTFLTLVGVASCDRFTKGQKGLLIVDPIEYYRPLLHQDSIIRMKENLFKKNYFIFRCGKSTVIIIKENDRYFIKLYESYLYEETQVQLNNKISVKALQPICFEASLIYRPIASIFSYVSEEPILYDNVDSQYTPVNIDFILCDSLGQIKLLANQSTMYCTRKYFKKERLKDIPLTKEQYSFLLNIVFDGKITNDSSYNIRRINDQ